MRTRLYYFCLPSKSGSTLKGKNLLLENPWAFIYVFGNEAGAGGGGLSEQGRLLGLVRYVINTVSVCRGLRSMGASQKMVDTHGTFRLGDTEFANLK